MTVVVTALQHSPLLGGDGALHGELRGPGGEPVLLTGLSVEQVARRAEVASLQRAGDWRAVLSMFQGGEEARDPLLLWVRPTLASLSFLAQQLASRGLARLASIGCGCGTLEWLLHQATGVEVRLVTGVEVRLVTGVQVYKQLNGVAGDGVRGEQRLVGGGQESAALYRDGSY